MPYIVTIKNNLTKEIRNYTSDFEWEDGSFFLWQEGNFSCDCNRYLKFELAGNNDVLNTEERLSLDCGTGKYSIPYITLPDLTKIKIDEE